VDSANSQRTDAVRRAKTNIDRRYSAKTSDAEDLAASVKLQAGKLADDTIDAAEETRNTTNVLAQTRADDSVNAAETAMTRELVEGAIPASIPIELAAKIRVASPEVADELLEKGWKRYGFKSLSGKRYTTNADELKATFKKALGNDPAMKNAGGGYESMVDDIFEAYGAKNGTIGGKALMELRNGMKAVKGGDGRDALVPAAYTKMADKLDTLLTDGLDKAGKVAFKNDLATYGAKKTLTSAVTKARTTRQGIPNASDVIGAGKFSKGGSYKRGRAPAQKAAENVQVTRTAADDSVKRAAQTAQTGLDQAKKAANKTKVGTENQASAGLKKSKAKIDTGKNALKVGAERKGKLKMLDSMENLNTAGKRLSDIKKASPKESVSIFERLFSTGLTGGGFGIPNIVSGGTMANRLVTENAQRFVAGQTGKQKMLAEFLRKYGDNIDTGSASLGGAAGTQVD
jgi:hypothetical protein